MKPWRAYGVWSSREYPYTDKEMLSLIQEYDSYGLPLNMVVLDYGWHYGPYDPNDVKQCNQPLVAGGQCKGVV
jgi:alpha-glucosidase (family GH31 glycosyl hydrolase)